MGQPYGAMDVVASERRSQVERTKLGLLLLLIGFVLYGIPYVNFVGWVLIFVAAILLIIGREPFGPVHSQNSIFALLIFLGGIVGSIILAVSLVFSVLSASIQPRSADPSFMAERMRMILNNFLLGSIVMTAISAISSVLFAYALQRREGRVLLLVAYAGTVGVAVITYLIIWPLVIDIVERTFASGTFDPQAFAEVQGTLTLFGLLNVAPSLVFAAATYSAWSRVDRGELPGPPPTPGGVQAPPAPP